MRRRGFALLISWFLAPLAGSVTAEDVDLVFIYSDLEPYVVATDKGVTGFLGDYLGEVGNKAGLNISWRYIPWGQQIPLLQRKQPNICGVAFFKTEERHSYLWFSEAIGQDSDYVLIGRKEDRRLQSYLRLEHVMADRSLQGIVQTDTTYGSWINSLLKQYPAKVMSGSTYLILRNIAAGEGDYVMVSNHTAQEFIARSGIAETLSVYDHFTDTKIQEPYFLACTLTTPQTYRHRLNEVIRVLGFAPNPE